VQRQQPGVQIELTYNPVSGIGDEGYQTKQHAKRDSQVSFMHLPFPLRGDGCDGAEQARKPEQVPVS
jgi:hypothetical protein